MSRSGIILWLAAMFILFSLGTAKAEVPNWHKPIPCIGCHQETIGASSGPGECGNCHDYNLPGSGLNIPLMQSEHNPNICRECHIGNTAIDASDSDIFHNGHNSVQCTQCHTADNSTVIKIEGFEREGFSCVSCHGNQIHGIHIKNLDKICSTCHGSWAVNKVYNGNNVSLLTDKSQASLGRFTLFSF